MASPFCQGREDNFFSPQDVEIEKDDEDKVSEWRTSARSFSSSAVWKTEKIHL